MPKLFTPTILNQRKFDKTVLIAAIPFLIFCGLLFKNISYPLFTNDEAETVVHSQQILKYGYPKMHDGKNFLFLGNVPGLGYKTSADANITMPWGHYYFAALPVFLSQYIDDFYTKTGFIRFSFALLGLIGLVIFILSVRNFYKDRISFYQAAAAFFIINAFSVPLLLNMREARYYSAVIFIASGFCYLFIRHFIQNKLPYRKYAVQMSVVLFFAYQINVPVFIIFCVSFALYRGLFFAIDLFTSAKKDFKESVLEEIKNFAPLAITGVLISPFIIFFETFSTIEKATAEARYNPETYTAFIERIYYVLKTQGLLYIILIVKYISLPIIALKLKNSFGKKSASDFSLEKTSFFLTLFFICFCLIIAKLPLPMMHARYFIVLQPVMALTFLLDFLIIVRYLKSIFPSKNVLVSSSTFIVFLLLLITITTEKQRDYFKEYLYQINHQYQGSLDFLIPFIKEHFKKTDNLVLATNYEELSYIYYLNCKVILGANINPEDEADSRLQPDILIYRKSWGHNFAPYNDFLQRANYQRISFPVLDLRINNITELDYIVPHLYRTPYTDDESRKTDIHIRADRL